MNNNFNKDSIGRLAVAFLERDPSLAKKYGAEVFYHIKTMLENFTLRIHCDETILNSRTYQAALLTAINVGKRCYKGGVFVTLPDRNRKVLLPGPESELTDAIAENGGKLDRTKECTCTVYFGRHGRIDSWRMVADSWTAVLVPPGFELPSTLGEADFSLGGVLGGAMAVGITFLKIAEFDKGIGTSLYGLSLWRPDIDFRLQEARGPKPESFPDKLWLLGLGHLGQAYSWTIGMLPFKQPSLLSLLLQDFDSVVEGNYDSGVLCTSMNVGQKKTRVASVWLENRGISTLLVERPLTPGFEFINDDPRILLGGVDNVDVRRKYPIEKFDLTLDVGLGSGLDFDLIRFNAFPTVSMSPSSLWPEGKDITFKTPALHNLSKDVIGCGFTLGIASSFTGVVSSCLAISEILRACMQGPRIATGYFSIRDLDHDSFKLVGTYGSELKTRFLELS